MLKTILKWVGIVVGVIVLLVIVLCVAVYVKSNKAIAATMNITVQPLTIPTDSASLAHGEHMFRVGGCVDCHGPNLGGGIAIDAPGFIRLSAPNLTRGRGGVGSQLSDTDWVRALRHGLAPDGHKLVLMPADAYHYWSDADLSALIAYVKRVPPVDSVINLREFGPIARMLIATGKFPLFTYDLFGHDSLGSVPAVPAGVTVQFGRYLSNAIGCTSCHTQTLAGGLVAGAPPNTPPASNLTPAGIGTYSEADFFRVFREGKKPGGVALNEFMPWRAFGNMTDDELRALWMYIKTVPTVSTGAR
jgi:mono/diheme cytochrome c family protein